MSSSSEAKRQATTQLLTTVYKQYWPVPSWKDYIRDDTPEMPSQGRSEMKLSSSYVQQQPKSNSSRKKKSMAGVPQETEWSVSQYGSDTSFAKLDAATLDRLGWTQAYIQRTNEEAKILDNKKATNGIKTTLTKAEYRRLSDQVRDVSMEFSRVFSPAANFQKSYQVDGKPKIPWKRNASHIYRSQLASSLRVFQKKLREPLEIKESVESQVLRSRPFSGRVTASRPATALSNSRVDKGQLRPRSVPASSYWRSRTCQDTTPDPGDFDTLDSKVLSQLIVEGRPMSSYGDLAPSLESLSSTRSPSLNNTPRLDGRRREEGEGTGSTSSLADDSDTSDDDEAGMGEEPDIDTHRSVPEISLRPEKWDAIYCPPARNDPNRFDFDAESSFISEYDFKTPFPDVCYEIDFRTLSSQKNVLFSLPSEVTGDRLLVEMMTRLGEIEKLELETIETEKRRKERQKQNPQRSRNSKIPSPMLSGTKDRNCCVDCLQVACIGNCPCKKSSDKCEFGHSSVYNETNFDNRPRQTESGNESTKSTEGRCRPKSCQSCKRIHTAKYINANNIILGRPRSSNSTFNRGQGSSKPKDLRVTNNGNLNPSVVQQFENLGIKTNKPSYKTMIKSKGRSSILPGKSYFSQRKDSLTKPHLKEKVTSVVSKKTKTQSVTRRPKTAE